MNRGIVLKLLVGDVWISLTADLPERNLAGFKTRFKSAANANAYVTCLNSNCSRADVTLFYDRFKSTLRIASVRMQPFAIEFLKNCEIPIFFQSEIDLLLDHMPVFKAEVDQIKRVDTAKVTFIRVRSRNRQVFESLRVELFEEDFRVALLEGSGNAEVNKFAIRSGALFTKQLSYGFSGAGSEKTLTYIQAHHTADVDNVKAVCYRVQLIPDILETGPSDDEPAF